MLEEVWFNPKNRLSIPPRRMLDPANKDTETYYLVHVWRYQPPPRYILVIKRKYFSALGWSRILKGSQQWFHHCTLKHTFQRNCLLFFVSCKTNTRGQGLHFLAVFAPQSCCPGLTHKALGEGKLSNLEPVNKPALTSYDRLLRMFLCY